jgi:hypothetical protein
MQLMDNVASTSFFLPEGLVVSGTPLSEMGYSGGGSPLLWQHLFWFLGHPEVALKSLRFISLSTQSAPIASASFRVLPCVIASNSGNSISHHRPSFHTVPLIFIVCSPRFFQDFPSQSFVYIAVPGDAFTLV